MLCLRQLGSKPTKALPNRHWRVRARGRIRRGGCPVLYRILFPHAAQNPRWEWEDTGRGFDSMGQAAGDCLEDEVNLMHYSLLTQGTLAGGVWANFPALSKLFLLSIKFSVSLAHLREGIKLTAHTAEGYTQYQIHSLSGGNFKAPSTRQVTATHRGERKKEEKKGFLGAFCAGFAVFHAQSLHRKSSKHAEAKACISLLVGRISNPSRESPRSFQVSK